MSKDKISDYSATANSNTDIAGINIDEGCAPSGINNAIRTLMKQLKDFQQGTNSDSFNGPTNGAHNGTVGATTPAAGTFTTLTASGNVVLGDASTDTLNVGNGGLIKDASGNLGLGVTPSAWLSTQKAFDIGTYGAVASSSGGAIRITSNAYLNSSASWIYKNTAAATLYEQDGGVHTWKYAASGTAGNAITFTQAMTLDASGNLGVGTTSPGTKVDIGSGTLRIKNASGDSNGLQIYQAASDVSSIFNYYSGPIAFGTNNTERARIDSSGNLLLGTTNSNPIGSNVAGIVSSPSGNFSVSRDAAPALDLNRYTSDGTLARFYRSATQVGRIDVTTTATSYVTSSDYRLKENPQPMQNALATVAQLKPCTYTWKVNGQQGQGFIAHELQAVVPDAVSGEKDAVDENGDAVYQGIDTSFLVATLTAAIQEQQAIIDSLKARLDAANL
jgi:hypothetical protein